VDSGSTEMADVAAKMILRTRGHLYHHINPYPANVENMVSS
jgi:hypothetical protein